LDRANIEPYRQYLSWHTAKTALQHYRLGSSTTHMPAAVIKCHQGVTYPPGVRARNSPTRPSPACLPTTASSSAWMAKEPGGTRCSSNGSGAASNTRRCICGPTKALARRGTQSAAISSTAAALIRALTATGPSLLQHAANPRGLTPADSRLIDAEMLFRQPRPALT